MKKLMSAFSLICIAMFTAHAALAQQFIYDAKSKRDPFTALVSADGKYMLATETAGTLNDIRLEGTLLDKKTEPAAVINGNIFKTGDEVSGFKLIKIYDGKVILSKDDKLYSLFLLSEGEEDVDKK